MAHEEVPLPLGGDDLAVSNQLSIDQPVAMRISEIPRRIFEELSRSLGIEDEYRIHSEGNTYHRVRKIDPTHPWVGFPGVVGLQDLHGYPTFVLWPYPPKGEDSVFEATPILSLTGGPQDTGTWAYGSGQKMKDETLIEVRGVYYSRMSAAHPAVRLIAAILIRASQLARDPACVTEQFWESEKNPEGDYTEP